MRILLLLSLFLASCGSSQARPDRPDPWEDYEPTPTRTYDEDYVAPDKRSAEWYLNRARKERRSVNLEGQWGERR